MNILAGRLRVKKQHKIEVSQRVRVSNQYVDPSTFGRNIAYVTSDDALPPMATPREALIFAATMRVSPRVNILLLVEQTLESLGLIECADLIIGNELIKGISGGQRKRTSVGVEIVTNPSLLFLDEPTSGLDAYSAYHLISLLKQIAASNCAILCSIHQPSSEIFHLFDIVQFMSAGRVLYHGSTSEVVEYFTNLGYQCPTNHNPADYIIFTTIIEPDLQHQIDHHRTRGRSSSDVSSPLIAPNVTTREHHAPWYTQLHLLVIRDCRDTIRNRSALAARFGVTVLLNILFGVIFLNAGSMNDAKPDNFNAHFGAITIITIYTMFGAAQPTILQFPYDRPLFLREYSTGTYDAGIYFLSKASVELPLVFLQVLIQFLIVYFLVKLQGDYFLLVLAGWGTGIASSSLGVVLGCLVTEIKYATELSPLIFVPQFLFAGFFIRLQQIPIWLRWAQYLCALKYGFNLSMLIEFSEETCAPGAKTNCENLLNANDVRQSDWWIYTVVLIAITLGFRAIGCCILAHKAKEYY